MASLSYTQKASSVMVPKGKKNEKTKSIQSDVAPEENYLNIQAILFYFGVNSSVNDTFTFHSIIFVKHVIYKTQIYHTIINLDF